MTEKEKGAIPDQAAPQTNDSADSTALETVYHPLTWRSESPRAFAARASAARAPTPSAASGVNHE